jgi:hypothetical protein
VKLLDIVIEARDPFKPTAMAGKAAQSPKALADFIKRNCSTVLDAYHKGEGLLYRGIAEQRVDYSPVVQAKIRPDRKPVQMETEMHNFLHDAFLEAGLKATRKNAIFCTTRSEIAKSWGPAYVVFPKNGWAATAFESGRVDYSFYPHIGMVRAASGMAVHDSWKAAKEKKQEHEPLNDVASNPEFRKRLLTYLVKLLKGEISDKGESEPPRNITTAAGLAEIIERDWTDVLITGDSYIALIDSEFYSDNIVSRKDKDFLAGVMKELGLDTFE